MINIFNYFRAVPIILNNGTVNNLYTSSVLELLWPYLNLLYFSVLSSAAQSYLVIEFVPKVLTKLRCVKLLKLSVITFIKKVWVQSCLKYVKYLFNHKVYKRKSIQRLSNRITITMKCLEVT